jgi:hypothetical protein
MKLTELVVDVTRSEAAWKIQTSLELPLNVSTPVRLAVVA